jgi:uncharacterized protein (TIGR03083 family)
MPTTATSLDLMALAHLERSELAALLATLTRAQWQTPSLCEDWTVRDVVAHMISYDGLTTPGLVWRFVRGGLRLNRINAIGVTRGAQLSTAELLVELNAHLTPRGLTAAFKGGLGLVDGLIHHQDIRRPLGIPRRIPPERLSFALDFALKAPTLRGSRLTKGLHLVATDLDWSNGIGPEVLGPGEALLMAIAGRQGIASELTGPGQPILQQSIGG